MTKIEYTWDGNLLASTVSTEGEPDVSHNRRWVVEPEEAGGRKRMVVTNDFTKRAGEPKVRYTRVYVPAEPPDEPR